MRVPHLNNHTGVTRAVLLLVLLTAIATTIGVASSSGAPNLFAPRKACGTITGPQWTFLTGHGTGSTYRVVAIGPFPCATAKKWVAVLVTDTVKNRTSSLVNNNVLTNGPKGYSCAAHSSKQGKAFAGACEKGPALNPTSGFTWSGLL
jgi:hypothetical protein